MNHATRCGSCRWMMAFLMLAVSTWACAVPGQVDVTASVDAASVNGTVAALRLQTAQAQLAVTQGAEADQQNAIQAQEGRVTANIAGNTFVIILTTAGTLAILVVLGALYNRRMADLAVRRITSVEREADSLWAEVAELENRRSPDEAPPRARL